MIEIKLSQGAKPGHGGVLPAAKITPEIAEMRGIPMGKRLHLARRAPGIFNAARAGRLHQRNCANCPVASRSASSCASASAMSFSPWSRRCWRPASRPDFIVVDGKEGGTGAAPSEFIDHIGMPLQEALTFVHFALVGAGLRDRIKIGASGMMISAFDIARTMALGADWVNMARAFMFAVGCIQSQTCHTDHCPTGVATQDKDRQKALSCRTRRRV